MRQGRAERDYGALQTYQHETRANKSQVSSIIRWLREREPCQSAVSTGLLGCPCKEADQKPSLNSIPAQPLPATFTSAYHLLEDGLDALVEPRIHGYLYHRSKLSPLTIPNIANNAYQTTAANHHHLPRQHRLHDQMPRQKYPLPQRAPVQARLPLRSSRNTRWTWSSRLSLSSLKRVWSRRGTCLSLWDSVDVCRNMISLRLWVASFEHSGEEWCFWR